MTYKLYSDKNSMPHYLDILAKSILATKQIHINLKQPFIKK